MAHKKKGPEAAGDGRVQRDFSHWHTNKPHPNNRAAPPRQEPIRAELSGSTVCTAAGFKVDTSSPVLAMCRRLIEAGFDPALRLECYRGDVLALTVKSIGQGAKLKVNTSGTGFIAHQEPTPGSPARFNGRADAGCPGCIGSSLSRADLTAGGGEP